jgi:hydrogenase nickel incorporation protein HypA/HybF
VHELPFTQSLLDLVTAHARRAGGGRVRGVHLVVGALSGIDPECVALYWDAVARGSCAEGAVLHVRRVPLAFTCGACGHVFAAEHEAYACPACASLAVRVTAGDERALEAIDLDPAASPAVLGEEVP